MSSHAFHYVFQFKNDTGAKQKKRNVAAINEELQPEMAAVSENESKYYLNVGEHLVGRKDCQIQVTGDQSVSRKHAWIIVSQSGTATAQVVVKDISRFGCSFVNGVKCQNSMAVILKHDDKLVFGTTSFRLKYESFVLFASCLDNAKKKALKSQLSKIGGSLVNEWQKECSYLVMEALTFTVKVIYALVTCCPIVTSSYIDDLIQAIVSKSELPLPEKYMPPIKEDLIDPQAVSFSPNEARKTVFAGKLFVFLEKKQHKRLEKAVTLAGGRSLLKEYGDSEADKMLTDPDTLVMSVDLKAGVSDAKQKWVAHVGDILRSVDRRPIPETEVGLAILCVSLEEYCNSSIHKVPQITKHIVSKVISTMEEMSQRVNESQNLSCEDLEKKPFLKPSSTALRDARKRSCSSSDESQLSTSGTSQFHNVDSKCRKLSTPDISTTGTEVGLKTPFNLQGDELCPSKNAITHVSQSPVSPNKEKTLCKTDITHISQTQQSQMKASGGPQCASLSRMQTCLSFNNVATPSSLNQTSLDDEKPYFKTDATTTDVSRGGLLGPKQTYNNITRVLQSQASPNEEKTKSIFSESSQSGRKLKFTRSKVTRMAQTPKSSGLSDDKVTTIYDDQVSPTAVKVKETPSPEILSKRRKISSPTPNITHISDTERSFIEEPEGNVFKVRVKETPSPEILCKRRKVVSPTPDITHISDTERSVVEEPHKLLPTKWKINEIPSPEISPSKSQKRNSLNMDITHVSDTERSMVEEQCHAQGKNTPERIACSNSTPSCIESVLTHSLDHRKSISSSKDLKTSPGKRSIDVKDSMERDESDEKLNKKFSIGNKSARYESNVDVPVGEATSGVITEDSRKVKSNMPSSSGVAWMCKKTIGLKKERISQNENINAAQEIEELNESADKQRISNQVAVKKEEGVEIPLDLLGVEHVELIVAKRVHSRPLQSQKKYNTRLRNMKRFKKQSFAGKGLGLPKIIGGNDLVVFSTRNMHVEEWMMEVQAMRQQDIEDRDADNLFRYGQPSQKRNTQR